MWLSDLKDLQEEHRDNLVQLVKLQHGVNIADDTPVDLVSQLEQKLAASLSVGICDRDVKFLLEQDYLKEVTKHMRIEDYPAEFTMIGVMEYRRILHVGIDFLSSSTKVACHG